MNYSVMSVSVQIKKSEKVLIIFGAVQRIITYYLSAKVRYLKHAKRLPSMKLDK